MRQHFKNITMKKILFQVCIAGSIALGMSSCHPDNDYTLSAPADRLAQLSGTWKLQNVIQTDLIAKGNNFADPSRPEVSLISRDITEAAPFTDLAVTFQLNNALPGTFTINYGNAPKIFKVSTGT